MSFYDDLADQLRQAEGLLEAERSEQAVRTPRAAAGSARPWFMRPLGLAGMAVALAVVVFIGFSSDRRTSIARAGLAILDADAVNASTVPLNSRQAGLANARTAHPFDTPYGTGYAFLSRRPTGRIDVCVAIPEAPEVLDNYPVTCKPRAVAEARGISVSLVGEEPTKGVSVTVLPEGVSTLQYRPEGKRSRTLPSVNGVVAFAVSENGDISWSGANGAGRQRETVTRSFPPSKLQITCRDGSGFYLRQEISRIPSDICAGRGGTESRLSAPVDAQEPGVQEYDEAQRRP